MCSVQPPAYVFESCRTRSSSIFNSTICGGAVCESHIESGGIMPDQITGTHLQSADLIDQADPDDKIQKELERVGEWVKAAEFQALSNEIYKCRDKERERTLDPLIKALNYKHIKFQIFRVVSRAYIEAGGAPAYLIPVRMTGPGTVWDESTPAIVLRIGQRVYFHKPIIVEGGMDFVLITAR